MYKLNPVIDSNVDIPAPDCIYKLKPIQALSSKPTASGESQTVDMDALERRQEAIIKRLEELLAHVENLKQQSSTATQPAQASAANVSTSKVDTGVLRDLVIRANPNDPPLSLLILQNLLATQYKVFPTSHTHSSAAGSVSDKLQQVFKSNGIVSDRASYQFIFTLVWKQEKYLPSLMISPATQTSIQGEANIARYLARLLSPAYDSGSIVQASEIDMLVDLAQQVKNGNNKEKAAVLRTLNARLGKSQWLVGSDLSLADIVLWAAIHGSGVAEGAPGNVKKWLDRCTELPAFKPAVDFL